MSRYCKNKKCGESLNIWSGQILCPACGHLARWTFGLGSFVVGVVWGIWELFR